MTNISQLKQDIDTSGLPVQEKLDSPGECQDSLGKEAVHMMSKEELLEQLRTGRILVNTLSIPEYIDKIHGMTMTHNKDGHSLLVVFVNSAISEEDQISTFKHEVFHIIAGHLTSGRPEEELEAEVEDQERAGFPCFEGWDLETAFQSFRRERQIPEGFSLSN